MIIFKNQVGVRIQELRRDMWQIAGAYHEAIRYVDNDGNERVVKLEDIACVVPVKAPTVPEGVG